MKKIFISSVCAMSMLAGSGLIALAEDNGTLRPIQISVPKVSPASQTIGRQTPKTDFGDKMKALQGEASATRAKIERARQILNENAFQVRKNLQTESGALSQTATSTVAMKVLRVQFQQQAEQEKQALKSDREEFQQKVEAQKEELKTKREQEKAKLKTDLEKIKDARKKDTVTNLDQRFTDVNQKITAQWIEALNRMDDLLAKISSRSDKATLAGKDVATTIAAIAKAKADIATTRAAVVVQTGKSYTITVTTDSALKSAVAQVRDTLNNDLKVARDLMQAAKKAVSQAAGSLSGIPRVDDEESTATSTSNQ